MRFTNPAANRSLPRALLLALPAILLAALLVGGAGRPAAASRVAELPPPSGPQQRGPETEDPNTRPVQPTPAPSVPFSVLNTQGNPNIAKGFTMALLDNNSAVSAMGFKWVAYTVDWGTAEPNAGQYNFGDIDNILRYVNGTDLHLLLRLGQSPAWANNAGAHGWYPPRNPTDFGVFAGQLALYVSQHTINQVAYEIWNEPNLGENWGCNMPSASGYTALVREAYGRIKSASGATVVAGAVTTVGALPPTNRPNSCPHVDDLAFIQGMYDAGAQPYFDVLSDHPYGFGDVPEAEPRTPGRTLVFRRAELHREIMVQRGDSNKQIWATEIGWALNPSVDGCTCTWGDCWYFTWSAQQQADNLVRAYQWARSYWSWMGAMFVFDYDFKQAPWYGTCHPFGLFGVKGRPAEDALRNLALNPPSTYTPLPTSTPTSTPTNTGTPTATSQPDAPPRLLDMRVNPPAVGLAGANVTVQVDAADNDSTPIDTVQLTLIYPNGDTQVFPMALILGSAAGGTWQSSFNIPANKTGVVQIYKIYVCVVEAFPTRRVACSTNVEIPSRPWRFADVPNDFWAYTPIEYLATHNIVSGYADGSFRPNTLTTRSQFSKMIVLAEGWLITVPPSPTFSDVAENNPFYAYVQTAYAHDVISGYGDGTFRPFAYITRAQLSKIIALAENWRLNAPTNPTFHDVARDFWAYSFVEGAVQRGVVSGYECGAACLEFRPNNNGTRAQLSKMVYQAILNRSAATATPTLTTTPTRTSTPTVTPTGRPSSTATPSSTSTPSRTPTAAVSVTATPTPFTIPTAPSKGAVDG